MEDILELRERDIHDTQGAWVTSAGGTGRSLGVGLGRGVRGTDESINHEDRQRGEKKKLIQALELGPFLCLNPRRNNLIINLIFVI